MPLASLQRFFSTRSFIPLFFLGYFILLLVGWLYLQLPSCQMKPIPPIDTLFTAASAISTAGLATLDIGKAFSFQGQIAILLLIQLGGLGYMLLSSYIFLHRSGVTLLDLVRHALFYMLLCELLGWALLSIFFSSEGIERTSWHSLFHTVAAFCTTGLSLFSTSLEDFKHHVGINVVFAVLSLLGSLGFLLSMDCLAKIRGAHEPLRLAARTLYSFITFLMITSSLLFFLLALFKNEGWGLNQLLVSFFQTTSAVTTSGFNTINLADLPIAALIILIILMFFGAIFTSRIANRQDVSLKAQFKQIGKLVSSKGSSRHFLILLQKIRIAMAPFVRFFVLIILFSFLLSLYENIPFLALLFEVTSATTNVGLSMGVTSILTVTSKSCIIFLMLMGRKGILLFGYLVSESRQRLEPQEKRAFARFK